MSLQLATGNSHSFQLVGQTRGGSRRALKGTWSGGTGLCVDWGADSMRGWNKGNLAASTIESCQRWGAETTNSQIVKFCCGETQNCWILAIWAAWSRIGGRHWSANLTNNFRVKKFLHQFYSFACERLVLKYHRWMRLGGLNVVLFLRAGKVLNILVLGVSSWRCRAEADLCRAIFSL